MIDLKFFYTIELNVQHPVIQKSEIYKSFYTHKWISYISEEFDSDAKCVKALKKVMKEQVQEFKNQGHKTSCSFEINPLLFAAQDQIDDLEEGEDDSSLVTMEIKDKKDWLLKGAVTIYGRDLDIRLH